MDPLFFLNLVCVLDFHLCLHFYEGLAFTLIPESAHGSLLSLNSDMSCELKIGGVQHLSLKLIIDLMLFSFIFIDQQVCYNLTNQSENNMQLLHIVLNDRKKSVLITRQWWAFPLIFA